MLARMASDLHAGEFHRHQGAGLVAPNQVRLGGQQRGRVFISKVELLQNTVVKIPLAVEQFRKALPIGFLFCPLERMPMFERIGAAELAAGCWR
jgi:hypothetical protein